MFIPQYESCCYVILIESYDVVAVHFYINLFINGLLFGRRPVTMKLFSSSCRWRIEGYTLGVFYYVYIVQYTLYILYTLCILNCVFLLHLFYCPLVHCIDSVNLTLSRCRFLYIAFCSA